eukprot:7613124-Alexandrium_andersonii.AAC.1
MPVLWSFPQPLSVEQTTASRAAWSACRRKRGMSCGSATRPSRAGSAAKLATRLPPRQSATSAEKGRNSSRQPRPTMSPVVL